MLSHASSLPLTCLLKRLILRIYSFWKPPAPMCLWRQSFLICKVAAFQQWEQSCLMQQISTWGSNDCATGFTWDHRKTQIYVTIHKAAKLQLCSSNENNFMAGAHHDMRNCIQGLELQEGWEPLVYWTHEMCIWKEDWLGNLAVILAKSLWNLRPEEDPWVPTMKLLKSSWNVCFG